VVSTFQQLVINGSRNAFQKKTKKTSRKAVFLLVFARFSSFFCVFWPFFQVQKSAFSMGAFFGTFFSEKGHFWPFFAKNRDFDNFRFSYHFSFKSKVVVEKLWFGKKKGSKKGSHRTVFLQKVF